MWTLVEAAADGAPVAVQVEEVGAHEGVEAGYEVMVNDMKTKWSHSRR